ncbi:hypothetical protein L3X38_026105 [Prunus dulcis]|uniref:Uncharacterized protein n=1 Tax=Prunus dulcis TaxID=3755 RepID=A0AAD4W5J5_PRUDU|nr:hypothetical protein L3X38_026105 [Prunus dulcis]
MRWVRIEGLEALGQELEQGGARLCVGAERNWARMQRGLALGKLAICAGAGACGPGGRNRPRTLHKAGRAGSRRAWQDAQWARGLSWAAITAGLHAGALAGLSPFDLG